MNGQTANGQTDEQLRRADVTALVAAGRWQEAMVPAALRLDDLGTLARSLTFLAEIVRRGGVAYAAALPEPLPAAEQSAVVSGWLVAALDQDETRTARWLDGVAAVLEARRLTRPEPL